MGVGGGALGMSDVVWSGGSVSEDEEASSSHESASEVEVGLVCCCGLEDIERFCREDSRPWEC